MDTHHVVTIVPFSSWRRSLHDLMRVSCFGVWRLGGQGSGRVIYLGRVGTIAPGTTMPFAGR